MITIARYLPQEVSRQAFRGFAIRYLPLKVPRQAFRGFAIRYLPQEVSRQAFRGFAIPGKQAVASRPLSVNRKPTLEESLSAGLNFLIRQNPIPLLGAINLRVLIRDKDDSLGRDAALVVGNPSRLAIRLLRLLDRHTHRHSDIDMQLLSSRILQMQQFPFPNRVAAVQLTSLF